MDLINATVKKGMTVQFGTYPQSEVTDATLLSTLNAARGTLPTSKNSQKWTGSGYYYYNGSVSSYIWYIDIITATGKYRGVYFTSYRPYDRTNSSSTSNSYQDDNGYNASSVYWFKYEPITWRVLEVQSSGAFLMSGLILDSQDYHYSTSNRIIGGSTVYANNYKESHIRSWLNDNFYNTAFTAEEKARIQTTRVDNSAASTGFSTNSYACANTSDKVFLLSYAEANSATYGLGTATSRQLKPSAYAQSQGVYTYTSYGNSYWWLRSPYYRNNYYAWLVPNSGYVFILMDVDSTHNGVVPALWISISGIYNDEKESVKIRANVEKESGRSMKYYMKAVGVTFSNRQRVVSRLRVGQSLRFVPEPDNNYDRFAVKIETLDGEQVGYISKDHNKDVFDNIISGKVRYEPIVSSITGGGFDTMYGVNIEVTATELL